MRFPITPTTTATEKIMVAMSNVQGLSEKLKDSSFYNRVYGQVYQALLESGLNESSEKAKKWDVLNEKVGKFYTEDCDEDSDLSDIGELCASEFGYL